MTRGNQSRRRRFVITILLLLLYSNEVISCAALAFSNNKFSLDRRDAMQIATGTVASSVLAGTCSSPSVSSAASTIDTSLSPIPSSSTTTPGPILTLPITGNNGRQQMISIPRVGYSLYKTDPNQIQRCISLALLSGVRHFDVASQYGNNEQAGQTLQTYTNRGIVYPNRDGTESPRRLDSERTERKRREELFVSHKIGNTEQSTNARTVKKYVKDQLKSLNLQYLDLCSVHSPLTNREKRLSTYNAICELQKEGLVRGVGVCNYGVHPLDEIISAGLPAPSVIQLELSPFNQHVDVAQWAKSHPEAVLSCAAWSKLSSASGPQDGWAVLANIAKKKGMTKAQVLVRWSLQKGYLCVPRSGVGSKEERQAIAENSYNGIKDFTLDEEEMKILNSLDEQFKAGKLGRRDGWTDDDVTGDDWDPTSAV